MTWIIGLLIAASLPASGTPTTSSEPIGHLLERLESEMASKAGELPTGEERQEMLRRVRYLHHLAHGNRADRETMRRLEDLEFQIRTGRSKVLARPAAGRKSLDKVGTVMGTVTRSSDGSPLANVSVELMDGNYNYQGSGETDASGQYSITPFETGEFYAITSNSLGYFDELYDDVRCPYLGGCDESQATLISVGEQGTTQVNFSLDLGGSIDGSVTQTATGEPVAYSDVYLWDSAGNWIDSVYLNQTGTYEFQRLETGTYFVTTETYGTLQNELFDDIPCLSLNCSVTTGTPVAVIQGAATSGIDFELDELGKISGTAIDATTGDPIPSQEIYASNLENSASGSSYTDETGQYTIGGLPKGTYYVQSGTYPWGFDPQLYEGLPCPDGSCDPSEGTPVEVELNETTSGIDFVLGGGCVESDTRMCLNDNRFLVEASWRTASGNSGEGYVSELTNDSGYFWFFGYENIELMVKVINACTLPGANNFWVFAGGLTDVEVTLTVTDTQTGTVRTYVNPQGTPFQPIQDTSAFDTCP